MALHPLTDPVDGGMLDVGCGHRVSWAVAGNPGGRPVVLLHGGPGSGSAPGTRRLFDPARWRIVQFDQRQCGRSTPSAAAPVVDLSANTTAQLVADIERLRRHLGIERWTVWGVSWGTTLGLAYAEAHPASVDALLLAGVVTTTRAEVEWVTRSMGRVFPEEWHRFRDAVPPAERDGDLASSYARLLQHPDPAVHGPAAEAWCRWEDVHVATHAGHRQAARYLDPVFRLTFARLVTHYWSHAAFLDDGQLLRDADRLAGIPVAMFHGRMDISGPADIPWALARAIPDAELTIVTDEGHGAGPSMSKAIVAATDRLVAEGDPSS